MKRMGIRQMLVDLVIAIGIGVVMTLLSGVPPLGWVHGWLVRNDLSPLWWGLIAGVIALCLTLLRNKREK